MRRKIEENDCMLIQGLEELRRKDLNIRALEKTQQRLASSLSQLERDIEVWWIVRMQLTRLLICWFICLFVFFSRKYLHVKCSNLNAKYEE